MNGWGVASYGRAKKMAFWSGIYSWWRCCEDCCNDKDLEYYVNLVDKAEAGFERIGSKFEKFYCKYNAIKQYCMLQRNCPWKEDSVDMASVIVVLF